MTKIKVIDSAMGTGKTSYLIDHINNDTENKYIYITPFLTEVDRIINNCKDKRFKQPKTITGSKLNGFNRLLLKGENIVSTHALFERCNEETINLIKSNDYILILDEVMNVVKQADLTKDDIQILFDSNILIVDPKTFMVRWNNDKLIDYADKEGRFLDVKLMCDNKSLFYVDNTLMVWTLPINIFKAFKDVYVATYMFKSQIQKYYYDYFSVEYDYYYISKEFNTYVLKQKDGTYTEAELRQHFKSLITIIDNPKLNAIGDEKFNLSKTWYEKNNKDKEKLMIDLLKANIYNYFRNYTNTKSNDNMWTTFKDYQHKIKGKGYSKGFVPCTSRATNDYCDKKSLAYVINRFLNPFIKKFFYTRGIEINEDLWALSEMLQWIYRGQIRQNKPIVIYIPSSRMRELLIYWLDNKI